MLQSIIESLFQPSLQQQHILIRQTSVERKKPLLGCADFNKEDKHVWDVLACIIQKYPDFSFPLKRRNKIVEFLLRNGIVWEFMQDS